MSFRNLISLCVAIAAGFILTGCVAKPYDYTVFRAHPPRSILVLPPLNRSTDTRGTYGYLSTVSKPLAEMGYYVYPVVVVDHLLKENGLPTAGEMHQIPLNKIRDIIGADAVLYITLKEYGSKYMIISSVTSVAVEAKLVDVKTGLTIWEGKSRAEQSSSSGNIIADLIVAAVDQAINSSTDHAHQLSGMANVLLLVPKDHGLLFGPYYPQDRQK